MKKNKYYIDKTLRLDRYAEEYAKTRDKSYLDSWKEVLYEGLGYSQGKEEETT